MIDTVSPGRLRQVRLARGLSLEEVARRMDDLVTKETLSRYETGASHPRPRILARLEEALMLSREAVEMLNECEEFAPSEAMLALMQEAGRKATETAKAELQAKGIAPVAWREGRIVAEGE